MEVYMAATVREDGKIGVFFVEEDGTPWTYWIGTYEAPSEGAKEYSWVSESTYEGYGILSSSDSTKEFTYKDGKISFPFTIEGTSGTMTMVREEWDVSRVDSFEFYSAKENREKFKGVEITDFEWCVSGNYLHYYVAVHNLSEEVAVTVVPFRITARDAEGMLLGTEETGVSIVYPGKDRIGGDMAFSVEEMPASVDIEILDIDDYDLRNVSLLDAYQPLELVDTGIRSDKMMGEIYNPNAYDISIGRVIAICRNSEGTLVDVETLNVYDLKAGSKTPFSTSVYLREQVENIEFFVDRWD